jgi:hypothetical protein
MGEKYSVSGTECSFSLPMRTVGLVKKPAGTMLRSTRGAQLASLKVQKAQ